MTQSEANTVAIGDILILDWGWRLLVQEIKKSRDENGSDYEGILFRGPRWNEEVYGVDAPRLPGFARPDDVECIA